jgi:hypothetical protein
MHGFSLEKLASIVITLQETMIITLQGAVHASKEMSLALQPK